MKNAALAGVALSFGLLPAAAMAQGVGELNAGAQLTAQPPAQPNAQAGVAWQAQAPRQRWLMVQDAALQPCVDRTQAQSIGLANRRAWWLVPASAVATCQR